eukprot:jgi/Astpho2/6749/fgenesh1_pg.00102_%23_27_t
MQRDIAAHLVPISDVQPLLTEAFCGGQLQGGSGARMWVDNVGYLRGIAGESLLLFCSKVLAANNLYTMSNAGLPCRAAALSSFKKVAQRVAGHLESSRRLTCSDYLAIAQLFNCMGLCSVCQIMAAVLTYAAGRMNPHMPLQHSEGLVMSWQWNLHTNPLFKQVAMHTLGWISNSCSPARGALKQSCAKMVSCSPAVLVLSASPHTHTCWLLKPAGTKATMPIIFLSEALHSWRNLKANLRRMYRVRGNMLAHMMTLKAGLPPCRVRGNLLAHMLTLRAGLPLCRWAAPTATGPSANIGTVVHLQRPLKKEGRHCLTPLCSQPHESSAAPTAAGPCANVYSRTPHFLMEPSIPEAAQPQQQQEEPWQVVSRGRRGNQGEPGRAGRGSSSHHPPGGRRGTVQGVQNKFVTLSASRVPLLSSGIGAAAGWKCAAESMTSWQLPC